MIDATTESIEEGRITRYRLARDGAALSYAEVLDLWRGDGEFRGVFTRLLADSPYSAYRWETPPLTRRTAGHPFEFVLLNCPAFASRPTDSNTYREYFTSDDAKLGVVRFANLRGDATLVVPSPRTAKDAYGHLAAFLRLAPGAQADTLWQVVAEAVDAKIGDDPLWLSTAGGGVAWLHVRIDSRPKYYGYSPYRTAE